MTYLAFGTLVCAAATISYQWGKLAAYREVKPLLKEMAEAVAEATIECMTEKEQAEMLEQLYRTEWRRIQ